MSNKLLSDVMKNTLTRYFRDYIMIIVGLSMYSFGFTAFILPQKVVIGGMSGIASLFYYKFQWPVGIVTLGLNFVLLAPAWRFVGKQFVIRTLFGVFTLSSILSIMQPLFLDAIVCKDDALMNIIIGSIFCGAGIGVVFINNGSTGGTDIIAAMVNKYSNVSIGRMMLYCDAMIISSSYLIFHSVDKIVYGIIVTIFVSLLCDMVINANRQAVQFTIISKKWEEIADAINSYANRGCTVIKGMGWYSKKDVQMLMVMCRKNESVNIFRIVKAIDHAAFITQANVNGVYGLGFDEVKVRDHHIKQTQDAINSKKENK